MRQPSGWAVFTGATILVILLFGSVFVKYPQVQPPTTKLVTHIKTGVTDTGENDFCIYVSKYTWQCETPSQNKYMLYDPAGGPPPAK